MEKVDLIVQEVARIADCHRNTVLRYESRGVIRGKRDLNGYRRFSLGEALKLKEILSTRTDELVCQPVARNSRMSLQERSRYSKERKKTDFNQKGERKCRNQ
jgi:DNA-binding transcriptional MerR regulator